MVLRHPVSCSSVGALRLARLAVRAGSSELSVVFMFLKALPKYFFCNIIFGITSLKTVQSSAAANSLNDVIVLSYGERGGHGGDDRTAVLGKR